MNDVVVVTGASKGIGRALALSLASRGAKVIGVGRSSDDLASLKEQNPDKIDVVAADIATEEGRDRILSALPGGRITHLVNNAAVMDPTGLLMDASFEKWTYQIAINLGAPLFLIKMLLPRLEGAKIINVSNLSRGRVIVGLGSYASTKAALFTMTTYLRAELARYDIAISSVYPGFVDTSLKDQLDHLDDSVPIIPLMKKLKAEGKLMPPATSAAFLTWLLLDVSKEEFGAHELWSVYDESHRDKWIQDHVLPLLT